MNGLISQLFVLLYRSLVLKILLKSFSYCGCVLCFVIKYYDVFTLDLLVRLFWLSSKVISVFI